MTEQSVPTTLGVPSERVAWGRVALFYGIAFGMVAVLGAAFALAGADFMAPSPPALVFQLAVAFIYMPMPFIAGLIVERIAGRRPLLYDTIPALRKGWKRVVMISTAVSFAVYFVNISLVALLGNLLGMPEVGALIGSQAQLVANVSAMLPAEAAARFTESSVPPIWILYVIGLLGGTLAGFTVNGLFAFGEEYGWRGVLMDELRPLGAVRANILTGVMWGLWHAPLILLGYNYGEQRFLGVLMMCLWVTPLSFLMWRAREYSGSVLAPAIIHGAFNGSAGFFLLLVSGRNALVTAPIGLVGAVTMTVVAAFAWRLTARSIPQTGDGILAPQT